MTALASVRSEITGIVRTADPTDPVSLDGLVALVYDELKAMAHSQLKREASGHSLQTTALVHEAYLKLVDGSQIGSRGRAYFFGAAARAMRQVLVDRARRYAASKRGGAVGHIGLDDVHVAVEGFATDLLDLDDALAALTELNARHARVIECTYFGGLTVEETADALDVSPRTVKYDLALARAWLYDRMRADRNRPGVK